MRQAVATLLALATLTAGCLQSTDPIQHTTSDYTQERLYRLLVDPEIHTIVVDIDYVEGRELHGDAIKGLQETLKIAIPNRDILIPDQTIISGIGDKSSDKSWNLSESKDIAERNKDERLPGFATIHILSLNGHADESEVGASAYYSNSMDAVFYFRDVLDGYLAKLGDAEVPHPGLPEIQRGILAHEVGHAVGLVNRGVPMLVDRIPPADEDPCRCHSTQEDSPLYYAFDRSGWLLEKAESNEHIPYRFNEDDLADLRAFREQDPGRTTS